MLISAVVIGLILMSTASTVSEIQETNIEADRTAHDINIIKSEANETDLADSTELANFKDMVNSFPDYSTRTEYNKTSDCLNIVLKKKGMQQEIGCISKGDLQDFDVILSLTNGDDFINNGDFYGTSVSRSDNSGVLGIGYLNGSKSGTTITISNKDEISTQSDFGSGIFDGSSADIKDNSGTLGIGYLNGSNPSSTNLEDGLVGYWRMDRQVNDKGTVKDYTKNGNDGVRGSSVSTEEEGVFSTDSFKFDYQGSETHSQSVNISYDPSLNPESLTISTWYYSQGYTGDFQTFFGHDYLDSYWLGISTYSGDGYFFQANEACSSDSFDDVEYNQWTHIAMTYDSSTDTVTMYENGDQVYTKTCSQGGDLAKVNAPFGIGNNPAVGVNGNPMNGRLDEMRIYNRSLSSSEIEELYFDGEDGVFNGNYTSKKIDTSSEQTWNNLSVDVSDLPSDTDVDAEFRALDSGGSLKDSQLIDLQDNLNNYSLSVSDSEDAEVRFNGTSTSATDSWNIDRFKVFREIQSSGVDDELKGYWRLDKNSGSNVEDYSAKNNDGTNNGASRAYTGVLSTNSFSFDGNDDYVNIPDDSSLDLDDTATISAWFKLDEEINSTNGFHESGLVSKNGAYGIWWQDADDGRLRFGTFGGRIKSDQDVWKKDVWYNLVAVKDNNDAYIYVNGVQDKSGSITDSINPSGEPLRIGQDEFEVNDGEDAWMNGRIDEVRVYDKALSTSEVEDRYFNGHSGDFEGEYEINDISIPSGKEISSVEVDSTKYSTPTAEFEVAHSDGETDSFTISQNGDIKKNHSVSISKTGGEVDITARIKSSDVQVSSVIEEIRVWAGE